MRIRTLAVALVVFGGLLGATAVGLGVFGGSGADLTSEWVSDTGRDVSANHHASSAGRPQLAGQPSESAMVYAPISGRADTDQCALYGLHAENGSRSWRSQVPAANCTIHSVADPTLADYDGDGTDEVLAATTERALVALHPTTGEVELRHELASYGYTRPVVADLVGDGASEIVVVDAQGTVSVLRANGSVAWSESLGRYTWGQPAVADFDADGAPELAVGIGGEGAVTLFEGDGAVAWNRTEEFGGSVTWATTGQIDDDPAVEIVTATAAGGVRALDGRDGETEWHRNFGRFAAVHALGDGDRDGDPEVYAAARDGKLRALDAATGKTEWTTRLTTGDVQMTPPPTLGDVDGDGEDELVAATNDGKVAVVAPDSGEVVARYERDVAIFSRPVLEDVDRDGNAEIFVTYGDGRVVRLAVE